MLFLFFFFPIWKTLTAPKFFETTEYVCEYNKVFFMGLSLSLPLSSFPVQWVQPGGGMLHCR